jgi:hypothetical protein
MMLETQTEKKVDGYKMLKALRYSYEQMGLGLLAIELSQGRDKAEEILASIDSKDLNECVGSVYRMLRQGAGL